MNERWPHESPDGPGRRLHLGRSALRLVPRDQGAHVAARRAARNNQPRNPWSIVTEPVYLTPAEVGAILRVHPRTVLRMAQQDATMPATRLGTKLVRFEKAALDRWLARKRPRLAQGSTQAASAAG